jgi:ribosomal protein S6--L-glutamate ligase
VADRFILGWEEWLSLPDLGLPAIKAKVDTGARTSALHAFSVEAFGPSSKPMVRFGVHPIPGRDDVEVYCTSEVLDRREVTSSNGERENRYVISTRVKVGERAWPIELTLTNRDSMAYRMLLGRQAIKDDMFVDATSSFRQPRLGYKVYGRPAQTGEGRQAMHIALLTRQPENASNRRLARAAEQRGHTLVAIDRTRVSLFVDTVQPAILVDGRPLTGVDAVIVRTGRSISSFTAAIVRQLELLGAYAPNPADALTCIGDTLALRQTLARAGVAVPESAVSHADAKGQDRSEGHILVDSLAPAGLGPLVRFAVVGGRAVAAMERDLAPRSTLDDTPQWRRHESPTKDPARHLAEQAARTLQLGLASIDILGTRQGAMAADVTSSISLALFERVTGLALSEAIIVELEQGIRTQGLRAAATRDD